MHNTEYNKYKIIILGLLAICIIFIGVSGRRAFHRNKTKVLLIGLDGAAWNIIFSLVKEGKLPNIKRLMDNGSFGVNESDYPYISEVLWTSIATGKSADKHNIKDRFVLDPETGELVPVTGNLRKSKAIWNILSEHQKKVGIVGYMCTWPAEKINGVMVSDRINPDQYLDKNYFSPPLKTLCNEEEFKKFSLTKNRIFSRVEMGKFRGFNYDIERKDNFVANFSKYILKKQDFDFFCLYIRGIDALSHVFWKYRLPQNNNLPENDVKRYGEIINDYYIWCDKVIGDILNLFYKDAIVIVVSDHGFNTIGSDKSIIQIERILSLSGLSSLKINSKSYSVISERNDLWWQPLKYLRIQGDLSLGELEEAKNRSKLILKNIKFKETNEPFFEIQNDTQAGFYIYARMPIIYENLKNHVMIGDREYSISDFITRHPDTGDHHKSGVIIISGKNIKHNNRINNSTIYDITPTILYMMDLPLDDEMKGKVLVQAIPEAFLKKRPVKYIQNYDAPNNETEKPVRDAADEERIKKIMRSLGYIN